MDNLTDDQMTADPFSAVWCGLSWTDWIPLNASNAEYRAIPVQGGVYRIRVKDGDQLTYVGQTRMGLRERLRMLMRPTYAEMMPFNDPHTAAPMHWLLRVEDGMDFECSASPLDVSDQERQVIEDMLLWRYRIQKGESTLANYGRFHLNYARPSNKKQGRPMQRLADGVINPASGPCIPPLPLHGHLLDPDWMTLSWSEWAPLRPDQLGDVPIEQGLYRIVDAKTGALLYIGETSQLYIRLHNHAARQWSNEETAFSYHLLPDSTLSFQRHELEADLIGAYYFENRRPPIFQYVRF